jgi:DNA-binding CsgD family transcriptional regulator
METRVVGLAVRGYADKLIAYHLGLAEGTASSHLGSALRKLGISNRVELVRQLGTRYPQESL